MKKYLIMFIFPFAISCQKDNDKPQQQTALENLQNKYLVCDSMVVAQNGTSNKSVLGKGAGFDIKFSLYGYYTVYSNPNTFYDFQYEKPDKLHYYNTGGSQVGTFAIQLANDEKLVLHEAKSGRAVTYYFTAEK